MPRRPYSTGCYQCRRMKVKCDEEKPQCARCVRGGRVCPGYREDLELIFRSYDAGATEAPAAVSSSPAETGLQILVQPSTKWEVNAISHFVHNYCLNPTNQSPGHLSFLPNLLSAQPTNSVLESAVLAAGFAGIHNTSGLTQLDGVAEKHYGRSLRTISALLNGGSDTISDGLVASIAVIQFYETIAGISKVPCDPHEAGLLHVIRLRDDYKNSDSVSNAVYQMIQTKRQMNLLGGHPHTIWYEVDTENISSDLIGNELWSLLRETSASSHSLRQLMPASSREASVESISEAFDKVITTYDRLSSWQQCLPRRWMYRSCEFPEMSEGDTQNAFPTRYHLFRDFMQGARWIGFWSARIHILQSLTRAVTAFPQLRSVSDRATELCSQQKLGESLREVVDDICASVPYMMDEIDQTGLPRTTGNARSLGSFFILRALYVSIVVECLNVEQRRYIVKSLLRIAHVRGLKLASLASKRPVV